MIKSKKKKKKKKKANQLDFYVIIIYLFIAARLKVQWNRSELISMSNSRKRQT